MSLTAVIPDRLRFRWKQFIDQRREAWWQAHAGEPRSFSFTLQPGVSIRLHLDSDLCRLIYCRYFEATERKFLNAFLRPGDIFVDVGANIGLFTLIAAERVGQHGRVLSFEPTPKTFTRLIENIQTNYFRNVSPFRLAVSDSVGQMEITQSLDGYDAWNSLSRPKMGKDFSRANIQTTTWDSFALENNLAGRVTMMKIDVEGWESRVLAGGKNILSRPDAPLLQVEFTDGAATTAGSSCQELYRMLEELGYQMFAFDPAQEALIPDPMRSEYPNVNLFATKNAALVNARLQNNPQ